MEEQIYNDITTKLLPEIAKGLTISKEYFTELFGRYIQYLIISDSISLLIGILGLGITIYITIKKGKEWSDDMNPMIMILFIPWLIFGLQTLIDFNNLIKDFYIPEIRIIELIQNK